MIKLRETISLCPKCYKQIPAEICHDQESVGKFQEVIMLKSCSECGDFRAVVENDADFYFKCLLSDA